MSAWQGVMEIIIMPSLTALMIFMWWHMETIGKGPAIYMHNYRTFSVSDMTRNFIYCTRLPPCHHFVLKSVLFLGLLSSYIHIKMYKQYNNKISVPFGPSVRLQYFTILLIVQIKVRTNEIKYINPWKRKKHVRRNRRGSLTLLFKRMFDFILGLVRPRLSTRSP